MSETLLLAAQDRERFISWLEREAASADGMVKQMESLHVPDAVLKKYRTEATACQIVVRMLRNIEEESLRPSPSTLSI